MTSNEPTIEQINRQFPDAEAFTHNGMCYAKLAGIIVIAAAPSMSELYEQMRDYFGRDRVPTDAWLRVGARPAMSQAPRGLWCSEDGSMQSAWPERWETHPEVVPQALTVAISHRQNCPHGQTSPATTRDPADLPGIRREASRTPPHAA